MSGTLVLGGCKSGKSSYAQAAAEKRGQRRLYVATGQPTDDEMKKKIVKHQEERGFGWETSEVEIGLSDVIKKEYKDLDIILVDCITAWVTNLLMAEKTFDEILEKTDEFTEVVKNSKIPVIMVSNEVGYGIVPVNSLARKFRDIAGLVNQKIAESSENVILTVAGIPTTLKGTL
ncbi:MAG: bifunctional adenosylcobinamide kinase/adenosylcobinamide-phosphate guanylyltransferase [Deltaproteobacteria bacterium]|nr:bifunctional adenosylcobinamide kinase/adenosylcobinamide-phosphate guanylyltransferase [Deltaproteobacteria bacterium]